MITVIGLDGSPLSAAGLERLASAELVVGTASQLAAVEVGVRTRTVILGRLAPALDEIDAALAEPSAVHVVVLASGDPGFFGILRALRGRGHRPEVFPALSSVALAFARVQIPWDDAIVVSAHGRQLRRAVNACRAHAKVAVLTAPGSGPAELARELFPQTPRTFVVCEDLGGPEERITRCRPAEATTLTWSDPNVVLVLDRHADPRSEPEDQQRGAAALAGWIAGARPGPAGWALADDSFEHRADQITGAEVRALALARIGPRVGDLVWDIGAGSGSVGIECARLGAAVIAVDRDEAACERIRRNVVAHGVKVAVSRGAAPAVLEHLPDPDAVFVGGGGVEVVRACAVRALHRVVVALAAAERVGPCLEALTEKRYAARAVRLQAARFAAQPEDAGGLAAVDPVFLVWGERV